MSTQTVSQDVSQSPPTTSALDYTTEVKTSARVVFDTGEKDSNTNAAILDAVAVSEDQGKKAETEGTVSVKVKGKVENYQVVEVSYQSFTYYSANTLAGITELCPTDEEVVNMFNRGISVKQQNEARAQLLSTDKTSGEFNFSFTEGSYDLKPSIAEVTNRRLSPTEKALETIKGLPPEQRAQLMAILATLPKQS